MTAGSRIVALGHYQPSRVITNDDLANIVETNDAWIRDRVGIAERRVADTETVADMATAAAEKALAGSGLTAGDIDDLPASLFAAEALLLASLEVPVATVLRALRRARARGMATVLNPAPIDPALREYAQRPAWAAVETDRNRGHALHITRGRECVAPGGIPLQSRPTPLTEQTCH